MPIQVVDDFPWWYTPAKWGTPLLVAAISAGLVAAVLTGMITTFPTSLEMLKWAPVLYSNLTGFNAFAVLGGLMGIAASITGVATSIFVRGLLLFGGNEHRAEQGVRLQGEFDEQAEDLEQAKEDNIVYRTQKECTRGAVIYSPGAPNG